METSLLWIPFLGCNQCSSSSRRCSVGLWSEPWAGHCVQFYKLCGNNLGKEHMGAIIQCPHTLTTVKAVYVYLKNSTSKFNYSNQYLHDDHYTTFRMTMYFWHFTMLQHDS